MNELLDMEIILKRKKYPRIYNIGIIILGIMGIFLIIFSIYNYRSYLIVQGRMMDGELQLAIRSDEVKYLINNNYLVCDNNKHQYMIKHISEERFLGEDGKSYQYVYMDVKDFKDINNYIYQVKVLKEEKKLIAYLKDYL